MADKVNLSIDQGATFSVDFIVTNPDDSSVDLSGYTGAGQIRKHYTSNTAVVFSIGIVANGVVQATLNANQTSSLSEGRYVYDIKLTNASGNTEIRIVEGVVTVNPQVTR